MPISSPLPVSGLLTALLFAVLLTLPQAAQAKRTSEDEKETTIISRTAILRGRASWYGREHQGLRTSNGERFDRFKYTCAHKTLPFGTKLRVTNPQNGKSVVVRVSDRGPFRNARILDLSEIAARPLGIVDRGAVGVVAEIMPDSMPLGPTTAPADLANLLTNDALNLEAEIATNDVVATSLAVEKLPTALPSIAYIVQAGIFSDPRNAESVQAKIQALDKQLSVIIAEEVINGRTLKRVVVGQFGQRSAAEVVCRRLQQRGIVGLVRQMPAGS